MANGFAGPGDMLAAFTAANGNGTAFIQKVALVNEGGTAVGDGAALPATTDRSGTITLGGTAQNVAAANASRQALTFQNTSDTEMRVTENGTAATATTGYQVTAGQYLRINSNKAVSVFCATTGKTFAATEW
jgi:hypothetical protein